MRFRGTKLLACVGVIAVVALVAAGCGSSSSSSSKSSSGGSSSAASSSSSSSNNGGATAPGVTATSITFGTHQPLTGPAAPGYSEIAPASQAFFDYVNAHGGVFGRKIHLIIKDDAYNPTNTVNVVHQLVLQSNVFGIFEGLGTPTHTKVVGFLNASKIPDMFVASGCPCWDNGTTQPYTFGWQPNYTIEGKILGQYIKQHFAGKKIGVLYQDDDFGQGGLAGIKDEVPASDIVSKEPYQSGVTTLAPQITAIKSSGAQVLVDFTVPIYTAIGQLTSFTLGYKPQLVVSNVGIDPTTVGGLLKTISKGKASGTALIEGAITDGYLPSPTDTTNPWIQLFMKIHTQYDAERAVRRQRRVRHGERLHARPGAQGRRQEPDPPGPDQRRQPTRRQLDGPGPRAVPLLDHRPRRLLRRRDGQDQGRQDRPHPAGRSRPRRPQGARSRRTPARSRRLRRAGFRLTEGCSPVLRPARFRARAADGLGRARRAAGRAPQLVSVAAVATGIRCSRGALPSADLRDLHNVLE